MEVADAIGWGEDTGGFTLLAHSRGTSVSLIAACAFPERVDHVVLVESRLGASGRAGLMCAHHYSSRTTCDAPTCHSRAGPPQHN